jgi:hypothetical protein
MTHPPRQVVFALIAFMTAAECFAADAPEAQPPGLQRSLVVAKQGYFSVALRLQDGRIAVVLRGGAPHLGIQGRLDMVFSSDEGKSWTAPAVVVNSPVDDRNPALGQAKDGTIVVGFWRTARYDEKGRYAPKSDKPIGTWVTRSPDGGKTWSNPTEIDTKDIGYGSPFGKILTLPDGTLLMAIYGEQVRQPGQKTSDAHRSYVYRSTDNGQTWARHGEISGNQQFNETALLRLPSGKIIAAMRSRGGGLSRAESTDDGATWSMPAPLTPVGAHPADLLLLGDGRILLVTGYRNAPFGVRGMVSDKNGTFDWDKRFVLVNDAVNADCGYPSSVLLNDGKIFTAYYATKCKEKPEWGVHCGAVTYEVP